MAIDVHFDACDSLTKGVNKAQIGICGFIRETVKVRNKGEKIYMGDSDSTA